METKLHSKRNFIPQVVFVILKFKKSQSDWLNHNHKDNYGVSCKPENGIEQMEQIFCQLQKALLLRIFQGFSPK